MWSSGIYVGLAEVCTRKEKRSVVALRGCISETVAHVKLGRVSASLSIACEGVEGRLCFLNGDGDRLNRGDFEKFQDIGLALCHAGMTLSADAQSGLEDGQRRGDRRSSAFQRVCQSVCFRLAGEDCHNGRGVNEHRSRFR